MPALLRKVLHRDTLPAGWSLSAMQIGAAIIIGAALGLVGVVAGPLPMAAIGAGAVLIAAALFLPEFVILLLLSMVSGLIPRSFNPYLEVASRGIFASDVILVCLLGVVVLRWILDKGLRFRHTALDIPMLLFLAAVPVGMITAMTRHGISFSDTTYEARFLLYYAVFFAVTNLVRSEAQLLRLMKGVVLVGMLLAVFMGIQAVLGRGWALMDQSIFRGEGSFIRFEPPGVPLLFIGAMISICNILVREEARPTLSGVLPILFLGAGMLLTLGRNLLVALGIGLAGLLITLRWRRLGRLALTIAIIAAAGAGGLALLFIAGLEGRAVEYLAEIASRLSRMLSGAIFSSSETLVPRWQEVQYAIPHLLASPLLGIGMETPYRPRLYVIDPLTHFIHNGYLFIWLKMGLLGLIPFLWLSIRFLTRGYTRWRAVQNSYLRAACLGSTLAYTALMFSNLVAPTFAQNWAVVVFAIIMGVNEAAFLYLPPAGASEAGGDQ
jgi:O-antigen ligase